MQRIVFRNFRIVDFTGEFFGSLVVEDGRIAGTFAGADAGDLADAHILINGGAFPGSVVLMPAFIDLHAHFREPGFPEKETLESASLAAVAGGFATVVCMANTNPVIDTLEKALSLKARGDALALADLYPVLSLTKGMNGTELSETGERPGLPLMLSEDGKDLDDDALFLAAMGRARVPVSCHCDHGGAEAPAVRRAIELGRKAGCHVHIAHVSTGETVEIIRGAKQDIPAGENFALTCEATPHHMGATEDDARRMGIESFGRVNPPLATEADRRAIVAALLDGTIDAIATDHAPHSRADKAVGAPGFVGLETAFAASVTNLSGIDLPRLSALASANPARILGLRDRGCIAEGLRADLVLADTEAAWKVDATRFRSRGRCTPFDGRELRGKILMTLNAGRIVFTGGSNV